MTSLLDRSQTPVANAIAPLRELGAYEWLWDQPKMWFTKMASLLEGGESLPSDFVSHEDSNWYSKSVLRVFEEANVGKFSISVDGMWEYPIALRDAKHPVSLLYYKGWWNLVQAPSVSVVGSREASKDGIARTRRIVRELVKDGYTIVSGLAKGVDTAAHTTALEEGGRTIAVLGTPLSETYPKDNKELQAEIAANHLVISQVPVCRYKKQDYRQNRYFFPERNKVMSALSRATVIVEAGESSGTLVQARSAIAQGRTLFILESCFEKHDWPAKFEKRGAIKVRAYEDIKSRLGDAPNRD